AQGIDGGVAASRAAIIGGCAATSNVLAGRLFGVPVKGTHAHSWVMIFDSELEAFQTYARAMPNNAVLLVDTYDTLEGVRRAVEVGRWLREHGHDLAGIRLDSGDLAWLSIEARKILDEGGFPETTIVASSDLEEYTIRSLKEQGAKITLWGVGTHLATAHNQPALGGVYKLSAIRRPGEDWVHKIKLSEQRVKISNPGKIQVRRFAQDGEYVGDMIYDELLGEPATETIVDPLDSTRRKRLEGTIRELLVPVFRRGELVDDEHLGRDLMAIQKRAQDDLDSFHAGIKCFENPHQYPAGLELGLHELKTQLILEARGFAGKEE
ncbi:MAG: nicotinate phosphoribosyltransferase, partial [Bradymonadaceae bacterium]